MEHQLATLSTSFNYINIHMWRWLGTRQHVQTWVIFKDIKGRSHRGRNGDTCASWKDTFDMFGRFFFAQTQETSTVAICIYIYIYLYIYIYWHVICTHTDKVSTSLSCHHLSDSYQFRCSAFGYGSCTFNVTVVRQKDLTFSMPLKTKTKHTHMFPSRKKKRRNRKSPRRSQVTALLGGEIVFFFGFMPVFLRNLPRFKIRIMFAYSPTTRRSSNMQTTTAIYNYKPTQAIQRYRDLKKHTHNKQNKKKQRKKQTQLPTSDFSNFSWCFESLGKLLLHFALQLKIWKIIWGKDWFGG